jgi:WD40 repeat protein/serine/threonine protein kinase
MASASSDRFVLLNHLGDEFAERYRRGERPSLQEYIDRYPELAEEIREFFPAMVEMEQVKGDRDAVVRAAAAGTGAPLGRLGDFQILREIGRGGMGVVYEAEQVSLGRRVALKVLSRQLRGDPRTRQRFEREARSAARLHHTNIVPVFGVGEHEGQPYYVMQFIQGSGLDEVLEELKRLRAAGKEGGAASRPSSRPAERQDGTAPPAPGGRSSAVPGPDGTAVEVARSLWTGRFVPAEDSDATLAGDAADGTIEPSAVADSDDVPSTPAPLPGPPSDSSTGSSTSAMLGGTSSSSRGGKRRPTYWQSVAHVGVQVADALQHAHGLGVLHRDIKPSNLLLDTAGVVWVADFGLAKATDQQDLTHTGDLLGTLRYMAPERFRGEGDVRADVYGLGVTLYELLALRSAFDTPDRLELIEEIKAVDPPRPRALDGHIPRDLETIVLKAIAKDPKARYPSVEALGEDLRRYLADEPIRARRATLLDRGVRWCRRNPAVAALAASVLVLLVAVAVVASVGYVRTSLALAKADEQRRAAQHERELARAAEAKATDEAARNRRLLYDADMQLAARLWQNETVSARVVTELLEAHVPRPGEEDLRDFTWRYQWRLLHDPPAFKRANPILAVARAPGGDVVTYDGSLLCWWDQTTHLQTRRQSPAALPNRCCCRFSPGGALLALGTSDGSVDLYDTATDQQRSFLRGAAPLRAMCFSPDGRKLVTIHSDRQARAWEVATARELATFALRPPSGANALSRISPPFRDCALASDGKTLALASHPDHHQVALYRAGRAEPEVLAARWDTVNSVVFSPDGRTIASGDSRGGVDLWDAAAGRHRDHFTVHIDSLTSLAFSPDGNLLGAGGGLGFVSVWALARRERVSFFKGYTGGVAHLAFGADGRSLVAVGEDGAARLWDLTQRADSRALLSVAGGFRVAYSPDGRWLAAGAGALALWDARTGVLVRRLERAASVAFSPDSKTLAYGREDSRVVLWDLETGRRLRVLHGRPRGPHPFRHQIGRLAFSPDGKWLAAGFGHINWHDGDYDQVVKVWDLASGREAATLPHRGTVPALAFSPDGEILATASHDDTVRLWGVGSWRLGRSWKGPDDFDALAFAPGGHTLTTGSGDGAIRLWDVATGQSLRVLGRHTGRVFDLAFSAEGKTLASASGDRTIKLWDVVGGRELRTLAEHTYLVVGVAFAPGGDALASGSWDGTVRLWDTLDRAAFLSDGLSREPQPDDAHARIDRARAYLALKQPDKALAEATRAVELQPDSLAARQARGEIALGLKKWAEALADYGKLVEDTPDDAALRTLHADLSARCEKWADAADDFDKLTRMEAADSPPGWYPYYRRALALLASGQQAEYRKTCAGMVDRFKTTADGETAFFTAWTAALGPDAVPDFAPVLRLAERAAAAEAQNARSHQAVGAVLYRMGRAEESLKHFDAAEATDTAQGQNSPAYWHYFRAMAHHRLGHKAAACNWLTKAVAETEKELRDVAQGTSPGMWVRKATLELLRAEALSLHRETAAQPDR